jgi:iron complex outermembrane recepter protein
MKSSAILAFLITLSVSAFAQSNGKISGKVSYGGNQSPLHEAIVKIVQLNRSIETDEDGSYFFENLPSGKYTITAHQDGFGDATKKVDLKDGESLQVDLSLQLVGVKAEVTITASGSEISTQEAIQTTDVIDSNKILERSSASLGDVLDNEPGVSKSGAGAGSSRPVIRGFSGDRVLVSSDGVRNGSLASQSGDHAEPVDTLAIERIEVVKGPATLLYGSNAIGGVVNAISGHDEEFHNGTRGYFSTLGSNNGKQGGISGGIEKGIKNWMFWGNGTGQRGDDITAGGNFGKVRNSFTRNASGTVGFGYYADKFFFNSNYNYYQSRYGVPLDFRETNPEDRSLKVRKHDLRFNGGFRGLNSFIEAGKFTIDYSNYQHKEIADLVVGTTFRNNVISYRGMFDQKKRGKLTGRFGFDGYKRDFSTVGSEELIKGLVKQNSFSVFGLEEYSFKRLTLQFGGRVENNRYRPTNPVYPNRDYTTLSGAIGAKIRLWEGGNFVANYSHAVRSPALEELYNNGPHDGSLTFEIGNNALKPEQNNGIDLSLRHQQNRVRAEFNYYFYDIKNYTFLAPTGLVDPESGFQIAKYLQGNSRYSGVEASLNVEANQYISVNTGFDYVNAKLKSGLNLPRIPPYRVRFGIDGHYKDFSIRPEVTFVGKQSKVFTNETSTDSYTLTNLAATYVIPTKHFANILGVNIFNLTNKLYFNHVSFIKEISPEIGRGVRFSYTIRFF